MGISKKQKERYDVVCACGCGKTFRPFPVYGRERGSGQYTVITGVKGANIFIPKFIRGHYKHKRGIAAWNKGLTKETCPTLYRMGFQPGHKPYNGWNAVNQRLATDPELKERWLAAKRKQIPWNKGLDKTLYPNGIKSGADHGNWCGGANGIRDTSAYKELRNTILRRDHWTCQNCGDHNFKGRGSRIVLDVHHIVAYSENNQLADDPKNLITLCRACHMKTENYGTKLIYKRRNQSGK